MASASGTYESADSAQRRERAAIAAQACQTCRTRKSKCDEARPKCGLCRRLNVECLYREPLPTKKDKTMVHILDTLARLENKFDNLALTNVASSSPDTNRQNEYGVARFPLELQQGYHHLAVPHKVILWPSIYISLINSGIGATSDLQFVLQEGTPWFIRQEMASHKELLDPEPGLSAFVLDGRQHIPGQPSRFAFSGLTIHRIQELCESYFNSFNVLAPVLNRDTFMADTMGPILQDGFADGDAKTVLCLFVIALGQVAVEGVFEHPIGIVNGTPSGFRGGSIHRPPGLEIFNEGRRRVGFVATEMTLINVQIMLLQATYYEATARHLDFWRSTVTASMACQVLIRCQTVDWQSPSGDMLKRAYWTCVLSEDLYHLDLDLPQTGVQDLEDTVPLPYFHEGSESAAQDDRSNFQYHFLAMIALRRLIHRIHEVIHESSATQAESADDYGGPPVTVIREMARQLESWRSLLPRPLQWQDSDKLDFPNIDPSGRRPNEALFSPDQGPVPIGHKHSLDLVTAQLRTRFYYARFVLYRPFVYKALHFPELMTTEDANCCALAIKSALSWPIAMAPSKNKKRLVPHLFAWTQNFMSILLILRMTTENECLKRICEEQVNREELQKTVLLMLEWVRDVRQVDGIAEWLWKILEPLYSGPGGGVVPSLGGSA
ncbi:related to acetate regulatory DNA binding protein FacB [Ramularia collo-cygni]|uniref:Related to acetate regulatory DNA binding protein FacB n=1 Tax=Ramularia collo-cygni TaxID=112498 RepID=A0A2D3UXD3_9PEZI|nr:related to acetate regulatory DNA binding protein FacB [Ramularia collo-cygni]CZT14774.1 related to acetate regulatory DNA binding protein FacB [Ramularia collo-cygni]